MAPAPVPPARRRLVLIEGEDGWRELRRASPGELILVGPQRDLPVRFPAAAPVPERLKVVLEDRLLKIDGQVRGVDVSAMRPPEAVALLAKHAETVDTVIWIRPSYDARIIAAIARLKAPGITLRVAVFYRRPLDAALTPLYPKVRALILETGSIERGLDVLARFAQLEVLSADQADWANATLPLFPSLSQLSVASEAVGTSLPKLRALRHLRMHCTEGGDWRFAALYPLRRLETLALEDCRLTDEDLARIGRMTWLRGLRIANRLTESKLTDKGLASLMRLSSLEELTLDTDRFTDQGLSVLAGLARLRRLEVGGRGITEAAAVALGKLTHLEQVDLPCAVGRRGMKTVSKWRELRSLALTVRTGTPLAGLATLRHLQELRVTPELIGDMTLEIGSLPTLPALLTLRFQGTLDAQGFLAISRQRNLVSLDLSESKFSQGDFGPLTRLPKLTRLDVDLVEAPDGSRLLEIARLRWLRFRAAEDPDHPERARRPLDLGRLTSLRHLIIRMCQHPIVGLEKLTHLETLDLYPATGVAPRTLLAALPHLRQLRRLELQGMGIRDADLPRLAALRNLQYLGLRGTRVTERGLRHLERLRSLREVNLVLSGISSEAADRFHRRHGTAVVMCCAGE